MLMNKINNFIIIFLLSIFIISIPIVQLSSYRLTIVIVDISLFVAFFAWLIFTNYYYDRYVNVIMFANKWEDIIGSQNSESFRKSNVFKIYKIAKLIQQPNPIEALTLTKLI